MASKAKLIDTRRAGMDLGRKWYITESSDPTLSRRTSRMDTAHGIDCFRQCRALRHAKDLILDIDFHDVS